MNNTLRKSCVGVAGLQDIALLLGVAAVYYFTARIGLMLAFEQTNATPVWPPSGIAFAAVILFGSRILPGIFLGAFMANLAVFASSAILPLTSIFIASGLIAMGNTLEAIAGAYLLQRLNNTVRRPIYIRDMMMFMFATVLMCLLGSAIGSLSLYITGFASTEVISTVLFTWWLGDTAGVLVITPLILAWANIRKEQDNHTWWISLLIISALIILISVCVFWEWMLADYVGSMPYLLMPLLLWAAYRCGAKGGTIAVFLVSLFAVIGTIEQLGPFTGHSVNASLLLLQTFICITAVVTLLLASAIEERNNMEIALMRSNEDLEERIAQRTTELAHSNKELLGYRENLEKLVDQRT